MPKKVTIDNLATEIGKILEDYAEDTKENLDEILKRSAKVGANLLRSESHAKFNGNKYWKGWTVTEEKDDRWGSTYVIHNKGAGLPHLLENGHAKRGGGRVDGRPHIRPAEQQIVSAVEREVMSKL